MGLGPNRRTRESRNIRWKMDELREYVLPGWDWLFGHREMKRRQEEVPEHLTHLLQSPAG